MRHTAVLFLVVVVALAACTAASWRDRVRGGMHRMRPTDDFVPHASGAPVDPTRWNYDTGLNFLYFAYAAYCPQTQLQAWSCKWCTNNSVISDFKVFGFASDTKTNTFGYVGYSPSMNMFVVSFRGTQESSLKDWIDDLESMKKVNYTAYPACNCQVGEGFLDAYSNLSPQVINLVKQMSQQMGSKDILVTGHSLGAALAVLCVPDMNRLKGDRLVGNVYSWNYGDPRVGDETFSDWWRTIPANSMRVVNDRDVVPHLPMMSMGFYHVPREIWELGYYPNNFTVCNDSGEDPKCSDSLKVDLSIYDHLHYFGVYESCST